MKIRFHEKQFKAISSKKRIINMISGIQGGKTLCGAAWLFTKVVENKEKNVNWLLTTPTYPIFTQATEPRFLEFFKGYGDYNRTDKIFRMDGNRNIYLRTLSNPNAIEGITNLRGIWNDEAGMNSRKAWINIEGRSAFSQCQIFNTTTPYALNWLWRDLYKPWKEGERDDVEIIQFCSIDNPFFPKEEFERQQKLLDPRVFAMKYMGQFERMAGLVYPDITEDNFEPAFKPRKDEYFICAGVDFGFNNPLGIVIRALHRTENRDYQMGEFYKSFVDTHELTKICLTLQQDAGVEVFYCDSEDPRSIADLSRAGVRARPVEKGPGSVENGIKEHNALIRTREYRMFEGKCPNTEDEYATYHYEEDQGQEANLREKPIDANNHCFVAGTQIVTANGYKPIEAMTNGDMVYTGDGSLRPVLAAGPTGCRDVYTYTLNGIELTCTPEHLVYTNNRGFVPVQSLMQSDILSILSSWLPQRNGTERFTADILNQKGKAIDVILSVPLQVHHQSICTGNCGKWLKAQYQRAIMFTTRTQTQRTTGSKTLNCSHIQNTSPYMEQPGNTIKTIWQESDRLQQDGIEVQRVGNGTGNTHEKSRLLTSQRFVYSAAKNFWQNIQPENTVTITAKQKRNAIVYNLEVEGNPEYFANGVLVHNCMDANRYVTMMTKEFRRHRAELQQPKTVKDEWELEEVLYGLSRPTRSDWYNDE